MTDNEVYLTALLDRSGPKVYARAGYIYITVKDRIMAKSGIYGLNGSLWPLWALKGRPEQGITVTTRHCRKG